MWKSRRARNQLMVCANPDCPEQRFPAKDLLFICPGGKSCPGLRRAPIEGQEQHYPNQFLFRAPRFAYSVPCPYSPHMAFLKVCPHCWQRQPVATGQSSTIAVIGSSFSGKTCYITALIHQIEEELARKAAFQMSLEWDDQDGLNYFDMHRRTIFVDGHLPEANQKHVRMRSLQITVRFPITGWRRFLGWRRWKEGPQAVVSMVFPDPAGELLENLEDAYFLHTLNQAEAIILMVDPFASPKYQQRLASDGEDVTGWQRLKSGDIPLNAFANNLRGQTGLAKTGKIPKDLAVVLTKCDEAGIFDPDRSTPFPVQASPYDPKLADEISAQVEQHMELDLQFAKIGSMARQNFRRVAFFAASALGSPPQRVTVGDDEQVKVINPKPRRVEEPFLWILHQRGYL